MEYKSSTLFDNINSVEYEGKQIIYWQKALDELEQRLSFNTLKCGSEDEINAMKAVVIFEINHSVQDYMRPLYFGLLNVLENVSDLHRESS